MTSSYPGVRSMLEGVGEPGDASLGVVSRWDGTANVVAPDVARLGLRVPDSHHFHESRWERPVPSLARQRCGRTATRMRASLCSDVPRPFPRPTGALAVNVINHLGDEMMNVVSVGVLPHRVVGQLPVTPVFVHLVHQPLPGVQCEPTGLGNSRFVR